MNECTVEWNIELSAENHEAAARKALEWINDPKSQAHVFRVRKSNSPIMIDIDLDEKGL